MGGWDKLVVTAAVAGSASIGADLVLAIRGGPFPSGAAVSLLEPAALLVLTVVAVRRAPTSRAVAAACIAAVAVPLWLLRFGPPTWSAPSAGGYGTWGALAALAVAVGLYPRALDRGRARAAAEARRAQRLDLADDLHDFVVHDINEMLLQAQAGQVLAGRATEEVEEVLRRIEQTAQRALTTVDRTVRLLSAGSGEDAAPRSPQPAMRDVPELVDRFAATGTLTAVLDLDPRLTAPGDAPAEVAATVYRVVVEALTNVRRHAVDAAHVRVVVARTPGDGVRAEVVDDGRVTGRGSSGSGRGQGLAGLGARVEALGGTLSAGPHGPAGWRVAAELPLSPRPGATPGR